MKHEVFYLYKDEKPPKFSYIYLLDNGKIAIYNTGINPDPKRWTPFSCFDCSFFPEQFDFGSPTLEWKHLSEQFVKPCSICKESKLHHMCGKDSHPYCASKIAENKERTEKLEQEALHDKRLAQSLDRGKHIFNFLFIRLLMFIGVIVAVLLTFSLGDFIYRKQFWFQVLDPAVKTSSNELQNIIRTIKE